MASVGPIRSQHMVNGKTEELFDLLTVDDIPLNTTKPRSLVHRDGDWHASIHIWLLHSTTGELLVQQRSTVKDSHPGMWDVSCAGHLSAGETSEQAAIAELQEELGIQAYIVNNNQYMTVEQIIEHIKNNSNNSNKTALYHICRIPRVQISQHGKFIDREHTDIYIALTNYTVDQYTLQRDEVDAVQYIEIDQFITMQQDTEQCEKLKYVPMADFQTYFNRAFNVIKSLQHYIVQRKLDQHNNN